ncbi:EamA family transporter [Polaribacter sp. Z014]|uniref:EamA family transporter n=1 Tax=unclassified Polaribacter TaxID=196858 RepID=UPI00193B7AFF|nr:MULTISPECIES: EamA family transporter [unclassified Polaribacter]MCL7762855.1 EamA family transporter [Polaribacter sp. Z014]QVY65713.1 EamA family transporter [Polaribacter sp. Q13]
MIYLIFSILFSTSLFVIFKYFDIYKIDTLKAIVVNYLVAFAFGFGLSEITFSINEIPEKPWFFGAIVLGALFVAIFFVMANTAQQNGVSVASVAGKMSVVIPVVFGVLLYDESVTYLKIIGILIALVSVYLASVKEERSTFNKAGLLFPILLFFGSGAIDTTLKFVEVNFVQNNETALFSGSLFGFAAFFGLLILLVKTIQKREAFGIKNIIAGIVLGIPNYFTIVFLIKAMQTSGFESSTLFTINNVSVVVVSTLVGLLLFKEKFSLKNKIGVALAILGIVLVTIA